MLLETIQIFLDESGDLGFGAGGSRYFVVAALAIDDPRVMDRLIKKENRRLKSKGARSIEHKFNKSNEQVRIQLLRAVSETNSKISWRAIEKVDAKKFEGKSQVEIYRSLCADVLNDVIPHRIGTNVVINLDRMASKKAVRESLSAYLLSRIDIDRKGRGVPNIIIEHQSSYNVPGLQVQDFVVGSVFQYLERGYTHYYQIIENKVIHGIIMS